MYQPTAIILLDSIGNATCTSTYNGGSTSLRFGKNKPVSFYIPIIRFFTCTENEYMRGWIEIAKFIIINDCLLYTSDAADE